MKKVLFPLMTLLMLICLVGCSFNNADEDKVYGFMESIPDDSDILYNVQNDCISYFNNKNIYKYDGKTDKYQSVVAYSSLEIGDYYTIGDSENGDFTLLRIDDGSYEVCFESKDDKVSYYPIGVYDKGGNIKVFMSYEVNNNGTLEGGIAEWTKNNGIANLKLLSKDVVMCGAIVDSVLYYTTYISDNNYSLYAVDCESGDTKLIKESIEDERLYSYDNNLYYYDGGSVVVGNVILESADKNQIYYYNDYMFDITLNEDSKNNVCLVYNISTGECEKKVQGICGFSKSGEVINLYSSDGNKEAIDCEKK